MAQFTINPLTESDTHEMIRVYYETFPSEIVRLFGGSEGEGGQEAARLRFLHTMKTDPLDRWIKVTDSTTGKLAGCSNWRLHTLGMPKAPLESPPVWLQGEERAVVEQTQQNWETRRRAAIGNEPHIMYLLSPLPVFYLVPLS
ncbi:hypothetical protein MBLNU230_g4467t1 [Neophaeotheca triangularis]